MKKRIILPGLFLFFTLLLNLNTRAQEAKTDCRVLLSSISEKYEGDCLNGFAHGNGIAEGAHKYEGEFKKGLPHGHGKYTWKNGDTYDGRWKKGKKSGRGKFYAVKSEEEIYGYWKDDEFIEEIRTAKIEVLYRTQNISKVMIDPKNSEDNHVEVVIMKDGRKYMDYLDYAFYGNSGILRQEINFNGLDFTSYPFEGTVRFQDRSYFNAHENEYILRFKIEEKGSYLVKIYI